MTNLELAKNKLSECGYTCALFDGNELITSTERGVQPLLKLLEQGRDFSGFSAADKVVGRAAAFLYVLLGIKQLYAGVISESAREVLTDSGVQLCFGELTDAIRNRAGDGFCPMETAVRGINDPHRALTAIKNKLSELKK